MPTRTGPRPRETYRAARKEAERGKRMAPLLKEWRKRIGATRAEIDRRRHALVGAGEARP